MSPVGAALASSVTFVCVIAAMWLTFDRKPRATWRMAGYLVAGAWLALIWFALFQGYRGAT